MQQAMGLAIGLAAAPWAEIITPTAAAAQPLWLRNGCGYAAVQEPGNPGRVAAGDPLLFSLRRAKRLPRRSATFTQQPQAPPPAPAPPAAGQKILGSAPPWRWMQAVRRSEPAGFVSAQCEFMADSVRFANSMRLADSVRMGYSSGVGRLLIRRLRISLRVSHRLSGIASPRGILIHRLSLPVVDIWRQTG
jgi:hypothetical protein